MTRPIALSLVACLCLSFPASSQAPDPETRGDAAWRRRAEGFEATGRVAAEPARAATAAYEEGVRLQPEDLGLRFKLMEALYFEGHFALAGHREQRALYDRLVEVAEATVAEVAERAGLPAAGEGLSLEERAARLAEVPGAARAHFWAAIGWGLWGMSHSRLAAAAKGVAGKIRDHAEMVTRLDERFADGGGYRLLGRLHTATPKVLFFTDWVDRERGVELLERACGISREDARNPLFLAEALFEHAPEREEEAWRLVREVAAREPDPERVVEESETIERARELLATAPSAVREAR